MVLKLMMILFVCLWFVNACDRASPKRSDGRGPIRYPSYKRSVHDDETSIQWDGSYYSIKLQENPCNFNTYDADANGSITQGEIFDILSVDKTTEALFNDLDVMKGDGGITKEEFEVNAFNIISECIQSVK